LGQLANDTAHRRFHFEGRAIEPPKWWDLSAIFVPNTSGGLFVFYHTEINMFYEYDTFKAIRIGKWCSHGLTLESRELPEIVILPARADGRDWVYA
jgi:hypothetical protein